MDGEEVGAVRVGGRGGVGGLESCYLVSVIAADCRREIRDEI